LSKEEQPFPMGKLEFVALIAMMFATIAFSVDAMLPALPRISEDLFPDQVNHAGLIITSFVLGMGLGTFIAGPLSDTYGRKRVIYLGAALYILAAVAAWAAGSLEVLLAARVIQGIGAAAPRTVSVAIVRDLFGGREMARLMSFIMLVFTLIPAIAPLLGSIIIGAFGWRSIFAAFVCFMVVVMLWMRARLPETLAPADRRPLRFGLLFAATREIFTHPAVRISIMVQSLAMAMLFSTLMLVQPIYYEVYDRAETFPYWFALVALLAGSGSIVNAMLVVRLGMRRMVMTMLSVQIVMSFSMLIFDLGAMAEPYGFAAFVVWQVSLFFQAGLTLGNLNAIAMEPMGHIAGTAASVVSAVSTVIAVALASPVGLMFDGTITPLVLAVAGLSSLGLLLMLYLRRIEGDTVPAG
jgi:DHA1 family bicyclomycin/chloramphenicol resistance-like MFS transporter